MKRISFLPVLLMLMLCNALPGNLAFAKAEKAKAPGAYDYYNPKERYAWYQAVRQYLIKHGGVECPPGYALEISKDGAFKTHHLSPEGQKQEDAKKIIAANKACAASVADKKFPLPANAPIASVLFPIRDSKAKAWSQAELDAHVFKVKTR